MSFLFILLVTVTKILINIFIFSTFQKTRNINKKKEKKMKLIILFLTILATNNHNGVQFLPASQCAFISCCCDQRGDITCKISSLNEQNFPQRTPLANTSYSLYINDLRIINHKFRVLPANAFDGLRINNLFLFDNDLETIKTDSFSGNMGIKGLYMKGQNVTQVELNAFEPIRRQLAFASVYYCTPETVESILNA